MIAYLVIVILTFFAECINNSYQICINLNKNNSCKVTFYSIDIIIHFSFNDQPIIIVFLIKKDWS